MLWLAGIASAATVAVLDFDGYGVSFTEAQTATQGMRDAFLEEGQVDPLSGSDIADGVSRGLDGGLRRARELVAEGRRLYTGGDPAAALAPLTEAVGLHASAYSDVGRRPEMADATFLLGLCLLKAGRATEARERFDKVVSLVPHYAAERYQKMPENAAALLDAAEAALSSGPRTVRTADEMRRIGAALNVDYVVTGSVNGEGALYAKIFADGRLLSEVKGALEEMPPGPMDGAYVALAKRLGAAGLAGESAPEGGAGEDDRPELAPVDDAGLDDELDDASLDEGAIDRGPRFREDPPPAKKRPAPTKITTSGAMRYDQGPLVERWWFWAGVVGVAGGGVAGVWYAATPAPIEYVAEPDGWSVTVALP